MSVKRKEYLLSVDQFKKPKYLLDGYNNKSRRNEKFGTTMLILKLLWMNPYTDPLHPDMGVGLVNFRYGMDNKDRLKQRIKDQIETYLPDFGDVDVDLVYNADHTVNINITIDDEIYVYDSETAPIAITLDDIRDS